MQSVAVHMAVSSKYGFDDNYLRTVPGLFPDLLAPLYYGGDVLLAHDTLLSAWVELSIPEELAAGDYTLTLRISDETYGTSESTLLVSVIDAVLPNEEIYFTQWFHADCLANYYNVEVWSERQSRRRLAKRSPSAPARTLPRRACGFARRSTK